MSPTRRKPPAACVVTGTPRGTSRAVTSAGPGRQGSTHASGLQLARDGQRVDGRGGDPAEVEGGRGEADLHAGGAGDRGDARRRGLAGPGDDRPVSVLTLAVVPTNRSTCASPSSPRLRAMKPGAGEVQADGVAGAVGVDELSSPRRSGRRRASPGCGRCRSRRAGRPRCRPGPLMSIRGKAPKGTVAPRDRTVWLAAGS